MASTSLTGGCGCGAVRFELTEPPLRAVYCPAPPPPPAPPPAPRGQRRAGPGASASALVAPGSVRVTQGEDRVRGWTPEGGRTKGFCADCGSALFVQRPARGATA